MAKKFNIKEPVMLSADVMIEDIPRFVESDLAHRARTLKTFGIEDAEKYVAEAAKRWAKRVLKKSKKSNSS